MAESLGAHYRFVKGDSRRLLRFPRGDDDDDDDVEDQLMSTPVDQSLTDIGQRSQSCSTGTVLLPLNEEPTLFWRPPTGSFVWPVIFLGKDRWDLGGFIRYPAFL